MQNKTKTNTKTKKKSILDNPCPFCKIMDILATFYFGKIDINFNEEF